MGNFVAAQVQDCQIFEISEGVVKNDGNPIVAEVQGLQVREVFKGLYEQIGQKIVVQTESLEAPESTESFKMEHSYGVYVEPKRFEIRCMVERIITDREDSVVTISQLFKPWKKGLPSTGFEGGQMVMLCDKYCYVSMLFCRVQAIIFFHLSVGEIQSLHDGWTVDKRVISQILKHIPSQGEIWYPFQLFF